MSIACLPMYDWPEAQAQTAAFWASIREQIAGLPVDLSTGGAALWHDPALVFSQTCWGPLSLGLIEHLLPLAQPDYSGFTGGRGPYYRSALVARSGSQVAVPQGPEAEIPKDVLTGQIFAFSSRDSLSGFLGLSQDIGADPCDLAASCVETGSHRASIIAVAQGRADVAAIDCRSLDMARRYEPCANGLTVIGWTSERWGLPYVTHRATDAETAQALRETLLAMGCHPAPKRRDL